MDEEEEDDDDGEERGDEDDRLYIEGSSEAEDELGFNLLNQQHTHSSWTTPLATVEDCPLTLVFPVSTGRPLLNVSPLGSSPSPTSRHCLHSERDEDLEHCDERIEEWMILGGEEWEGDRNIHLNLGYWSSSCSESDSGTEDEDQDQKAAFEHNWAITAKDKGGIDQPRPNRYFTPDRTLTCHNCNKTGHLAKSCSSPRKRPTCVLCGLQGHVQRGCPGRHCPSCGLPSHGHQLCPESPVWNQYCHRCGMTGHLTDACPDTWRQYHFTTQEEAPLKPQGDHTHKPRKRRPHCYNCSRRGHHGHECTMRRMVSGTFPSVPYVCHYDTKQDILKQNTRIQRRARELQEVGFMPLAERQRTSKAPGGSGEEERSGPAMGRLRSHEARREGRRKTWPEKRRERREVKRLRREAQARRGEGAGGPGRIQEDSDLEVYPRDAFRSHHRDPTPPPQKKRRSEEKRSRKSRESERWKKRGGLKHGDLYPRDDLGPMEENFLSPKHRVRHRRR